MSVSYVKARAEALGLNADVGVIERPERLIIGLTSIGLSGLGIPYVLPIGMWGLAAGTAFTLYQRMRAVYVDAKAKSAMTGSATAQATAAEPATAQAAAAQAATAEAATAEAAAGGRTASPADGAPAPRSQRKPDGDAKRSGSA